MKRIPVMEDFYSLGTKVGEVVSGLFFGSGDMELEIKADATPVTIADKTVYKLVGDWRDALFPDLAIVSEEGHKGELTGDPDQYHLRLDEIDGTVTYVQGQPAFSSLFALIRGSKVVASMIVDPIGRRIYTAEEDKGAFCNKVRIKVQQALPPIPTVGIVSWPYRIKDGKPINNMLLRDMLSGKRGSVAGKLHDRGFAVQDCPSIGYFDAFVAAGKISATIFPGPTLHDTAAGDLLVREAGGVARDLYGHTLSYSKPYVFGHICASRVIYQVVEDVVSDVLKSQQIDSYDPLLSWKF